MSLHLFTSESNEKGGLAKISPNASTVPPRAVCDKRKLHASADKHKQSHATAQGDTTHGAL